MPEKNFSTAADTGTEVNHVLDHAILTAAAGRSVVQVNPSTKRPYSKWESAQSVRATPEEIERVSNLAAFAVVTGAISAQAPEGFLVCLDFDVPRFYFAWRNEVGPLAADLPIQRTGGGGYQVFFESPFEIRNEKLAWAPSDSELTGREIAIETRGEGGYAVVAPSMHPCGNRYQWLDRDLTQEVPFLHRAQAQALLTAAKNLCEAPRTRQEQESEERRAKAAAEKDAKRKPAEGGSVIEAYNIAHEIADTLTHYGYREGSRRGGRWIRPGGENVSITVNREEGWSFHHNVNDPLSTGHTCRPFDAFCILEHGGDAKAAVKAAAVELGMSYGKGPKPPTPADQQAASDGAGRPIIDASEADARVYAPLCWSALEKTNGLKPRLFRIGGGVMRLEFEDGLPALREMRLEHFAFELARAAIFTKTTKKGRGENAEYVTTQVHPPKDYVRDMSADDNPPLPMLRRIVAAPVFASDGTLQTDEGYHPASKTYYHPGNSLRIPDVPKSPTPDQVRLAMELITKSIQDFPFVSAADRTNALAFAFTPFARDFIEGPTPLGDIEATGPGTGKGLLVDTLLIPAIGRNIGVMTQWGDEEECRKRVTAVLKSGKPAVLLDNVVKPLNSGTFAGALTAIDWEDRMMATHETRSFPVRCVWLMTANNPVMSTEIARRCVRIRLDAKCERAWQRDNFEISNLRGWVHENRAQLIGAYLTVIQAWVTAGRPMSKTKLGSYEDWAAVIGGILELAGQPDFLGNLQEFYDASDNEGAAWRELVERWEEAHGFTVVSVGDLFKIVEGIDSFPIRGKSEKGLKTSFGQALLQKRDSIIGGFQIVECGQDRNKARQWRLAPTTPKPAEPAGPAEPFHPNSRVEDESDCGYTHTNGGSQKGSASSAGSAKSQTNGTYGSHSAAYANNGSQEVF
jgi:hypothetical protein